MLRFTFHRQFWFVFSCLDVADAHHDYAQSAVDAVYKKSVTAFAARSADNVGSAVAVACTFPPPTSPSFPSLPCAHVPAITAFWFSHWGAEDTLRSH